MIFSGHDQISILKYIFLMALVKLLITIVYSRIHLSIVVKPSNYDYSVYVINTKKLLFKIDVATCYLLSLLLIEN